MIPFGHKTCLKIDLESIIESKILPMIDFEFSDQFRALNVTSHNGVCCLQMNRLISQQYLTRLIIEVLSRGWLG